MKSLGKSESKIVKITTKRGNSWETIMTKPSQILFSENFASWRTSPQNSNKN